MLKKAAALRAEQGHLIPLTLTWSCSLILLGEPGLRPGQCASHPPALGSLAEEGLLTSSPVWGAPPVAGEGWVWLVPVSLKGAPFSQKFCPDGLGGASLPRVPVGKPRDVPRAGPAASDQSQGDTWGNWQWVAPKPQCLWAPPHALLPLTPPNYFSWML